jgi:hypothetical protein
MRRFSISNARFALFNIKRDIAFAALRYWDSVYGRESGSILE